VLIDRDSHRRYLSTVAASEMEKELKENLLSYDLLIIAAHPDDAEVQMGGTIAKMTGKG